MSKIEYFSLEGLRVDGRRKDELRNTRVFCGGDCSLNFLDYDGISEVVHGLNKVQVLVRGPSEDLKNPRSAFGTIEDKIDIQCEIVIATEKKVKNSQNERLIKDLALAVKSTYEEMVISHYYRGCALSLFINVVEYDGSLKSTLLNAVGVALVDAGVALRDMVAAATVAHLDSVVLTGRRSARADPNHMETNAATALLCLAVESSTEKVGGATHPGRIHRLQVQGPARRLRPHVRRRRRGRAQIQRAREGAAQGVRRAGARAQPQGPPPVTPTHRIFYAQAACLI